MNESATIEETITRLIADIDWTDECEVLLHLRKRTMRLTPAQARRIASALTRSAEAAERAAASAVRPVAPAAFDFGANTFTEKFFHPECVAGKCSNCDGQVLTIDDRWVPCQHHCHTAGAAA